jgi:hypothetical protein
VHRMIEQSIVHLPELVKDTERPVSIYLVHLSRVACRPNHPVVPRNPVRSCRRSWTDRIYRIQDDERISAWLYPEPRYRFDTPGEGAAVLMAPGIEAVKETARRVPASRLQRIGSQPVSSATRAGERDRLWPELWSTTRKKSTRWC